MSSRKKTENISDILDNCLELMLKGESIEGCLKTYPEQARELEPLLEISAAIIQNASAIQPAPGVKDRVRSRLQGMLYARAEQKRAKVTFWRRRWAVALASVLVIFIAGIGAVAASANALPDQPLYPIKLASEEMRLALAFSHLDKAELHVRFAQRRTAEMVEVARLDKDDRTFLLAEEAASHIDQLETILELEETRQADGPKVFAPPAPSAPPVPFMSQGAEGDDEMERGEEAELVTKLTHSRARNLDKLQQALGEAPEELKPSLEQAIENVARNYDRTIFIIKSSSSP